MRLGRVRDRLTRVSHNGFLFVHLVRGVEEHAALIEFVAFSWAALAHVTALAFHSCAAPTIPQWRWCASTAPVVAAQTAIRRHRDWDGLVPHAMDAVRLDKVVDDGREVRIVDELRLGRKAEWQW